MIFVLIIIGVCLILINIKAIKKEDKTFKDTYVYERDNITEFEVEIGKLRKEFAETLIEIQSELEEIKAEIADKKETDDKKDVIEEHNQNEVVPDNPNNIKIDQVNKMFMDGHSVEDIAEKLQLGKGEVLLIRELYSK